MRAEVNNWLKELGTKWEVPLELEDNGLCVLQFGDELYCVIEAPEGADMVYMYCPLLELSELSEEQKNRLYRKLLEMNFLGIQTAGASFAVDSRTEEVILWLSFKGEELDAVGFENILGNFIEVARTLRAELQRADTVEEAATEQQSLNNIQFFA